MHTYKFERQEYIESLNSAYMAYYLNDGEWQSIP
jgi:hypothetical protein